MVMGLPLPVITLAYSPKVETQHQGFCVKIHIMIICHGKELDVYVFLNLQCAKYNALRLKMTRND